MLGCIFLIIMCNLYYRNISGHIAIFIFYFLQLCWSYSRRQADVPCNAAEFARVKWIFIIFTYDCAQVSKRASFCRSNERTFFLFSDVLMYAKPRLLEGAGGGSVRAWGGGGGRTPASSPSLVCCCILPLHHCRVERVLGRTHGSDEQGALFTVRKSCRYVVSLADLLDKIDRQIARHCRSF